ncbi:hypothetical protein MMC17_002419 [Xylographa soralifera]|nr:hypothetical protein [Xylographa soralifera]
MAVLITVGVLLGMEDLSTLIAEVVVRRAIANALVAVAVNKEDSGARAPSLIGYWHS